MSTGNLSRKLYAMELCATNGLVVVPGSFRIENTGPVADDARGDGFSVAYNEVAGQYLITLAEKYPGLVSCVATAQDIDGANDDVAVSFEPYDAAAGTIVVKFSKEGTGVLAPADTDNVRINFCLFLQKFSGLVVTHA